MTARIHSTGQNNWHHRQRTAGERARADAPLQPIKLRTVPLIPVLLRWVGRRR